MSSPLRIKYPDAWYHVSHRNRGHMLISWPGNSIMVNGMHAPVESQKRSSARNSTGQARKSRIDAQGSSSAFHRSKLW